MIKTLSVGKYVVTVALMALCLAIVIAGCTMVGSVKVSVMNAIAGIEPDHQLIFAARLPRILMAAMVGAALAVAGVAFQALLRNPLADPYILGVSGGAAFGAVLAMVMGFNTAIGGISAVPIMAYLGAVSTIFLVYKLGATRSGAPRYTLLLAGVIVNAFFGAVIMFATSIVDIAKSSEIVFWLMGNLSAERYTTIAAMAVYLAVGTAFLMSMANGFNIMALGDDAAAQLGTDVGRLKQFTFAAASLVTAVAVARCGPIGFVGLIVPHAVRLVVGPDHRILLPASFFAGAVFLAVADTFARTVIAPTQVPVGVVTAICGGPFFLLLLFGRARNAGWE